MTNAGAFGGVVVAGVVVMAGPAYPAARSRNRPRVRDRAGAPRTACGRRLGLGREPGARVEADRGGVALVDVELTHDGRAASRVLETLAEWERSRDVEPVAR
jgi:hypothetical protein